MCFNKFVLLLPLPDTTDSFQIMNVTNVTLFCLDFQVRMSYAEMVQSN